MLLLYSGEWISWIVAYGIQRVDPITALPIPIAPLYAFHEKMREGGAGRGWDGGGGAWPAQRYVM